ncbi:MAG: glycosyl hydrolase [Bacteroidales bacterium]|nr:glycosyl hydrolase [Bacteroidales bacterium]
MKKNLSLLSISLALTAFSFFSSCSKDGEMEKGFKNPPKSIQTSVYWYWVSDNISEEGVIKDLKSMKEAGINRAFIGNIGLGDNEVAYGDVKFGSEEWWKILHTAMKTATDLDIELGVFNSPGWSQSGGPWIKPEQAMRYLASTSTEVDGGKEVNITLSKPEGYFEDVRVLAYPAFNESARTILRTSNSRVKSTPAVKDLNNLIDGSLETTANFDGTPGSDWTIDFSTEKPVMLRSIKLYVNDGAINSPARLQVKNSDGNYTTISEFKIDRYNSASNVGFDAKAPVVVSFAPTQAKDVRLIIKGQNPGNGFRQIVLSDAPALERYPEKTLAKMFQSPLPYWNEYQWPRQFETTDGKGVINPDSIIDLTANLDGDNLKWDAPQGKWVILRTGMRTTGVTNGPASKEAVGLEVDKMSKKHVESHFDAYMGEIIRRIPEQDRKCWKVVVQDSYETGGQNFTDEFLEEFKEVYGYDPIPFLPVFSGKIVKNEDISDRFLWDLRRLIADKVAYDYVGGLRDVSHKYGLTTWLENYGHWGFPGEFLQYGGQSDEIGGEYWGEGELGNIENRAASSCGHIYGKTKISAESFTCGGAPFKRYPGMMKQRGDRFFSEGINNTLLHVYIEQPYDESRLPGVNAPWGTEFNRNNTWFEQIDLFTSYLKRVNFMLQQGLNVADVAYFIGEDAPKMTGVRDPEIPKGYQFDYINAEVIEKNMTVKDGLLTLPHGTQYKILVLPKLMTMRPALLEKIKYLVEQGAVILGPAPEYSPSLQNYPQADNQVKLMAAQLWKEIDGTNVKSAKIGNGMVINGMDMKEALDFIKCVPDCKTKDNDPILYGHRTVDGKEIYFVSNQSYGDIEIAPEFRVKGLKPQLWDATTGSIRELPSYSETETGTIVPMKLASLESAFIVFNEKSSSSSKIDVNMNYPQPKVIASITDWEVKLDENKRGPKESLKMTEPQDLSKSEIDDVKYYSGNIIYKNKFNLDSKPEGNIFIDMDKVYVMAKVKINGQYAGGVWTEPYRLDISNFVKTGENDVEIEVVNTWVNRIVGDLRLPEDQRKIWMTVQQWNAETPLEPSGLVGPVVIESIKYID